MAYQNSFAEWFRGALQHRGLSAGQFAKSASISRSAAYFYCSGDRLPTRNVVTKIANALGIAPSELPSFQYGKPGRPRTSSFKLRSLVSKTRTQAATDPQRSEHVILAR
jgi:transcriptional regulator with XRE-family HTH domain